jgi:hypothetical protein
MRKSCENGQIFTKFCSAKICREIFAKLKITESCRENEKLTKFDSDTTCMVNAVSFFLHDITFWEDKKNKCGVMLYISFH